MSTAALGSSPPEKLSAILDTGSSGHFFALRTPLQNIKPSQRPIQVELPDHRHMESTHEGDLPIPTLPPKARKAYLFPALQDTSLISIGQLCDAGCQAIFNATQVQIIHLAKVILEGYRDKTTRGLWYLDLPSPHTANAAVNQSSKPEDLINFAHAALFSPANSTLLSALTKGFLPPFPGLDVETFRKYPPCSAATIKGHLDTTQKNQKSTKEPE